MADKASKMSDRGWVALLMLFGMVVLGFILHWHREDQKAMTELFRDIIRANTEALNRSSLALERLERLGK